MDRLISFEEETCLTCGCIFYIPTKLQKHLRETKRDFYCPNGHMQHYVVQTEGERFKACCISLEEENKELREILEEKKRSIIGYKGLIGKLKKQGTNLAVKH